MLKLEDLKKLKNEKLLSITIEMEQMLVHGAWSTEYEVHLKRLQLVMNLFLKAQINSKKPANDTLVFNAQKSAEQSYRRLYLHLKSLVLEDNELLRSDAKRMLKRMKLTAYDFERKKQAEQVQYLWHVIVLLENNMADLHEEETGCIALYKKLIENSNNYRNAMDSRATQATEAKKSLSPTKLRPQLIKAIRHFYIYISISGDEANEKLRMQQLKDMERIARKGVKRKYVRKNVANLA